MKHWSGAKIFLSTLTSRKLSNAVKLVKSYYLSKYTGRYHHSGMPVSIAIEPTTACNLGCPECPSGLKKFSRPTGTLKKDFFQEVLDQLAPTTCYLTFYFQGEPYINPGFLDMVSYAVRKGMYTSTSTNAHFLDDANAKKTVESGLHRIIISIDGTTQETYEQYRINGELEKVLAGTRSLVAWKKKLGRSTPHIIFQFLVVRQNEDQVDEIYRLARELEVDEVKLKTAQFYDFEKGNPLMPINEKYSRYYKAAGGKYRIKNELANGCWRLWNSAVITWDGKVVPCCFDKDAKHQLGDLRQHTFEDVWNGEVYREFRTAVLRSRKEIDICSNCSEGTKVWL